MADAYIGGFVRTPMGRHGGALDAFAYRSQMRVKAAGIDAVVAQGSEAGGHRGTFAVPFEAAMVATMALVPQIVDAVNIPVIASGGIMDGRGIVASRALGAEAVQMGTAFLVCDESSTAEAHKTALLNGREDATVITRAFSGRPTPWDRCRSRCRTRLPGRCATRPRVPVMPSGSR